MELCECENVDVDVRRERTVFMVVVEALPA